MTCNAECALPIQGVFNPDWIFLQKQYWKTLTSSEKLQPFTKWYVCANIKIAKMQNCPNIKILNSPLGGCCDVYVQGHGLGGVACILIFFVHSEEQFFRSHFCYHTFHTRSQWPQTLSWNYQGPLDFPRRSWENPQPLSNINRCSWCQKMTQGQSGCVTGWWHLP